jgi:protein-S-isoprenylcysteine O-methyltransferase Ste14
VFLYTASALALFTQFKSGRLIESGAFSFSRNPIYASFVFFGIPTLAFALRSWLVMSIAIVAWVATSVLVREEEQALEAAFGDEYRRYAARVSRMLPFPPLRSTAARAAAWAVLGACTALVAYVSAVRPWLQGY